MKPFHISILLVLFIFVGCGERTTKKENASGNNTDKIATEIQSEEISTKPISWLDAIKNKSLANIKDNYSDNAFKIVSADSIIAGSSAIADYYINLSTEITESQTLFLSEANKSEGIHYELISYRIAEAKEYAQAVIWKSIDGVKVREFEYTVKRDISDPEALKDQISKRRDLWIQLCNKHNAENLVKKLYTSDAIYFNHKPLVIGAENISKEYRYMNNDNYNLTLKPLIVEIVTGDIAFEIGKCAGSYGGKYVIVWKKEPGGRWKVFIDSNF
ncbi:YybH family protein [Croceitalea rosinachiae]|uniref:DUF4440 domain-containing protein n=1 Tax=Croceitalea rosinachiae TaxID=3075596 RepID=A0ABU3AE20_9FLAO|nr:hypothetical protein [Croceitalea sp. F388]MDT0608145.1 hypothetical protein [Croceitalea sp. F388]